MFYCDACRIKYNWPSSLSASLRNCETCGIHAACHDAPEGALKKPYIRPGTFRAIRGTYKGPTVTLPTKLYLTDLHAKARNSDLEDQIKSKEQEKWRDRVRFSRSYYDNNNPIDDFVMALRDMGIKVEGFFSEGPDNWIFLTDDRDTRLKPLT